MNPTKKDLRQLTKNVSIFIPNETLPECQPSLLLSYTFFLFLAFVEAYYSMLADCRTRDGKTYNETCHYTTMIFLKTPYLKKTGSPFFLPPLASDSAAGSGAARLLPLCRLASDSFA